MTPRPTYPTGVPCWIDLVQADADRSEAFYAALFGWTFDLRTPADAPMRYSYARLADGIVGGLGSPATPEDPPGWTSYVTVDSAEDAAASVVANGGTIVIEPADVGTSGRVVQCADPEGARFGLWQPGDLDGSEVVNAAGSWNFSELNTDDPAGAARFYGAVFGWELAPWSPEADDGTSGFFRRPGYGEVLAEANPAVLDAVGAPGVPAGFADAVAVLQPLAADPSDPAPHWSTTFAVADAHAAFARAVELGAEAVIEPFDTPWTRQATVLDPQGVALNLSEYRPG